MGKIGLVQAVQYLCTFVTKALTKIIIDSLLHPPQKYLDSSSHHLRIPGDCFGDIAFVIV